MSKKYTNKLLGKRVLVIGGTSGIGFCVAENALEHGAVVTVASSKQASIDKTVSRLHNNYPDLKNNIKGHIIDLRSDDAEASIVQLLKFVTDDGKDLLDHITITAGDSLPLQPISAFEGPQVLDRTLRVRLTSVLFIAKHAPGVYLKKSNRSTITLTGGINSYIPGGNGWTLPALAGTAGQGLIRGLAVELRPIRVNMVEPGPIDTELFQSTFTGEQMEEFRKVFRDTTLTGQIGNPEDTSEAYIYIMKDAFFTGQTVLTEGGMLLAPGINR